LIAEKQESVDQWATLRLRTQEQVFDSESHDSDVTAKVGQVVLVGPPDLLDDAVQAKALEAT
jgi:hypothetical protein